MPLRTADGYVVDRIPAGLLLRELPASATAHPAGPEELNPLDLKALTHLEEALAEVLPAGEGPSRPQRCPGPVGHGG